MTRINMDDLICLMEAQAEARKEEANLYRLEIVNVMGA